jgi:hypothetical protein
MSARNVGHGRRLIDRDKAVELFRGGLTAVQIGERMGFPRPSIVRVIAECLGSARPVVRERVPRRMSAIASDAHRLIAIVRKHQIVSIARLMGETGWSDRRVHNTVAYARAKMDVPLAMVRFGSRGFETYYQIAKAWPAGEREAA